MVWQERNGRSEMSVAKASEVSATSTTRDATQGESGPLITWSLRGGTYVPVRTTRSGLGRLDQDRANSMTDEGGPPDFNREARQ